MFDVTARSHAGGITTDRQSPAFTDADGCEYLAQDGGDIAVIERSHEDPVNRPSAAVGRINPGPEFGIEFGPTIGIAPFAKAPDDKIPPRDLSMRTVIGEGRRQRGNRQSHVKLGVTRRQSRRRRDFASFRGTQAGAARTFPTELESSRPSRRLRAKSLYFRLEILLECAPIQPSGKRPNRSAAAPELDGGALRK